MSHGAPHQPTSLNLNPTRPQEAAVAQLLRALGVSAEVPVRVLRASNAPVARYGLRCGFSGFRAYKPRV